MKKLNIETILAYGMLIFAIGFNLWLYKLEPTATIDPNDNAFQFALVDRTNTIWDFASKKCSSSLGGIITYPICQFSYMADHWVNNWAEGFNLPFYYSHVPQIMIVGSWRFLKFFTPALTLFQYYHIIIYLLMCFFPLSIFWALLVMDLSPLTAGIGAIFAMNLSTDGLYGLDPSSFLWRGYGLSSQLFAMIWLPLAIAYTYKFLWSEGDPTQFFRDLASRAKLFLRKENSNNLNGKSRSPQKDSSTRSLLLAIFFLTATTAGHLGIGMIGMLSVGFLALARPIMTILRQHPIREFFALGRDQVIRMILICGVAIFILSYWIIPVFLYANYHNISFWDPVWKFNSYGIKATMIRLFNGELFDFGRAPVITYLTLLGVITTLYGAGRRKSAGDNKGAARKGLPTARISEQMPKEPVLTKKGAGAVKEKDEANSWSGEEEHRRDIFREAQYSDLSPLAFLFIFWLLFYFGRTTWGGLIDLIPGMVDFHLSRFLVGLHVAGMLLAPIGFMWIVEQIFGAIERYNNKTRVLVSVYAKPLYYGIFFVLAVILIPPVYRWTITYNDLNNALIVRANDNHAKVASDEAALFAKLRSLPPARIFAGRGGSFGKNFKVAETPYFMNLSTYGLPTTLWLPETWSMDSDTEQYFSEDQPKDYDLYNIRWVAAPPDTTPQPFWNLIDERPTWKLYEVPTTGYFTLGVRPATVAITKTSFMTVVHLWIQSNMHKYGLFPELTFDKSYPHATGIPNFKMLDEVTYKTPASPDASQGGPDGSTHNLFSQPPVYLPPGIKSMEQFTTLINEASQSASSVTKYYLPMKLVGPETNDTDMVFKTTVAVGQNCKECMVILKQSYHPSWRVWVDGKAVKPIIVFPFYIGIPISQPGVHTIVAAYQPSTLKMALLYLAIIAVAGVIFLFVRFRRK